MSKLDLLSVVNDEIIKSESIPLDHLWMLSDNEKSYGPFRETDLQALIHQNPNDFKNLLACSLSCEEWSPLFKVPIFDRRNQEKDDPDKKRFHHLKIGKVQGPYSKNEIIEMLENKTISPQEYLSIDSGLSWKKLYDFNIIDRRNYEEIEVRAAINLDEFIVPYQEEKKTKNLMNGAMKEQEESEDYTSIAMANERRAKKNYFKIFSSLSACFALVMAFGYYMSSPNSVEVNDQEVTQVQQVKKLKTVSIEEATGEEKSLQNSNKKKASRPKYKVLRRKNSRSKKVARKRAIIKRKARPSAPARFDDAEIVTREVAREEIDPPSLDLEDDERFLASEENDYQAEDEEAYESDF